MLTLKNLHKSYTTEYNTLHVLKGLDLEIEQGEFVSIMGSSGSGKSTLLNILGILDDYDEGEYRLTTLCLTCQEFFHAKIGVHKIGGRVVDRLQLEFEPKDAFHRELQTPHRAHL